MKKILGLAIAALLIMAIVGGGTWAYFSDTETGTATISAGTLDLNINGGNSAATLISVSGKAPGESGNGSATLANVGSITGYVDVSTGTITNTAGAGGTEFEGGSGELGGVATIAMFIDVNNNGQYDAGTDIGLKSDGTTYTSGAMQYATINSYGSKTWNDTETLANGTTQKIVVAWQIPTSADNTIQGDSASFTVTVTLEQH